MRTRVLAGLAGAIGLAGAWPADAAAQTIAAPAPEDAAAATRAEPGHPPAGLGGAITVGRAGMAGVADGWLARLDYEVFPVLAPRGTPGPIFGFHVGWELWRAPSDTNAGGAPGGWGLSLPALIVLGIRAQPVRATLGVGVDALVVDVVGGDTGVGFYAPLASARAGLDVLGVQLGVDARITRRWQIGAPDHTQWQVGAFAGMTWESKDRRPRY